MSDGIVKGWIYNGDEFDPGKRPLHQRIEVFKEPGGDAARMHPVLLIPDDGSQVVVGREEWEAMRALLRYTEACEGLLNCSPAKQVVRAAAILGTNGCTSGGEGNV